MRNKPFNYGPLVVITGIVIAVLTISYLIALVIAKVFGGVVGL